MKRFFTIITLLFVGFLLPDLAMAQSGGQIKLTITPPMIRNNVNPGQIWRSSIKLVNNNSDPVDIYVRVNDFKGGKEDGTVEFLPALGNEEDISEIFLSQWIEIDKGPVTIEPYKSIDIPFSIRVPETAEPGGHYAAILAGTRPEEGSVEGSAMKVSSLLASLILLNVQGEVEESGSIREFSTSHKYYGNEEVDFNIRFQNSGNVHIQPQGEIRIYNMFGKDRGSISINHGSPFGNVLPGDIRRWEFNWQPQNSLLEMGRHKAVLILGYGNQARQTVDRTLYFWVIFPKPLLITLGSLFIFITLLVLSIKFYIRRAIIKTQREVGIDPSANKISGEAIKIVPNSAAVVDLKAPAKKETDSPKEESKTEQDKDGLRWSFLSQYSRAIIIVVLMVFGAIGYVYYRNNHIPTTRPEAKQSEISERPQVETETINKEALPLDTATSSEEEQSTTSTAPVAFEQAEDDTEPAIDNDSFYLSIRNGSGYIGAAADIDKVLYAAGYKADDLGNADNFNYQITLIKYSEDFERLAQKIGSLIDVKVEMQKVEDQEEDILIIVGKNIR